MSAASDREDAHKWADALRARTDQHWQDRAALLDRMLQALADRDEAVRLLRDARPYYPTEPSSLPNVQWREARAALLKRVEEGDGN